MTRTRRGGLGMVRSHLLECTYDNSQLRVWPLDPAQPSGAQEGTSHVAAMVMAPQHSALPKAALADALGESLACPEPGPLLSPQHRAISRGN